MSSSDAHKSLIAAISNYLPSAGVELQADADDVQTVRDTLNHTFKVESDTSVLPGNISLLQVFEKGLEALNISLQTGSAENPWAKDPVEDSPVFLKFLENVSKKGYFGNAEPGSEEYNKRYQKVLAKFKSRMESKKISSNVNDTT